MCINSQQMHDYNEDEDEEMDNNPNLDLNENYDKFISGKVIYSIEDIEAKQLSMRSQENLAQSAELDQDGDSNYNNSNEIYYNETRSEENYDEDQNHNNEFDYSTNDEADL